MTVAGWPGSRQFIGCWRPGRQSRCEQKVHGGTAPLQLYVWQTKQLGDLSYGNQMRTQKVMTVAGWPGSRQFIGCWRPGRRSRCEQKGHGGTAPPQLYVWQTKQVGDLLYGNQMRRSMTVAGWPGSRQFIGCWHTGRQSRCEQKGHGGTELLQLYVWQTKQLRDLSYGNQMRTMTVARWPGSCQFIGCWRPGRRSRCEQNVHSSYTSGKRNRWETCHTGTKCGHERTMTVAGWPGSRQFITKCGGR
jgi:hypothetical protein